ncbi:MAG TPA: ABC transporter permease [Gemmatimonadales bacterium]|nr:ABC transporter permease [Gemmatimonadales bacterium]
MSLWRQLNRGVRVLLRRGQADRELDAEIEEWVDHAAADLAATGLPPTEARRTARARLGSTIASREEVREHAWEHLIAGSAADLRYAARRLRKDAGFAALAILTLAVGIGAATAIFSAVNPVLFERLPYPEPQRLVTIADVGRTTPRIDVTYGTYRELAQRSHSFASLAVLKVWQPALGGIERPDRLDAQRVSAGYFRTLGVAPAMGRDFTADDDRPKGPDVVILGHALWQRLGGDADIVGRAVTLDDTPYTVVGVMPAAFENLLAPSVQVWAPLQYGESFAPNSREWGHHLRMVGRLRPGVDREAAARELAAIAGSPLPELPRVPWADLSQGLALSSLHDEVTQAVRPALLAVVAAVLLLLGITGVNVTNLLLARGVQRQGEFAMRAALGAGRRRLLRQLLIESLLLAVLGGLLGLAVAEAGVRVLVALSPSGLPRLDAIRVDPAVLAFACALSALVGIGVGVVPALQASRPALRTRAERSGRRSSGDFRRTRGSLVVAQVALALVLLVSAGLLYRSLSRLLAVDTGFDGGPLLTMQVQVTGHRYDADSLRYGFLQRSLEAVRAVPGVAAAAYTSQLPLSDDMDMYGVHLEGEADPAADGAALRYAVTPGYFHTLGIPLREGRVLDEHDGPASPRAVVVSESFARTAFPGVDAIGQRLRFGDPEGDWYTVVGVVGDVRQTALGLTTSNALYVTPTQWHWVDARMSLVVRAKGVPATLTPAVRAAIWSVDTDQPVVRVATMRELVAASVADRRFALIVFEAFGAAALVLAAVGLYGILSVSVTERTREIGVRSALGASTREILALVLRQGMALTAVGVVLGLALAWASSRSLAALLFELTPLDPVTYAGVVVLLLGVAVVACWGPAWRAARLDPALTLRAE